MRTALLLLPLLLLAAVPPGALTAPAAADGHPVVEGPLLTPPNPAAYATAPFVLAPPSQPLTVSPAGPQERVLAILIQFSDVTASQDRADLETLLFDEASGAASLTNYYWENSYGQTRVTGDVTARWYTSSHTMEYYGADGDGIDDANVPIYCLTAEAVLAAEDDPDGPNFADYDTDGDGVVDHLMVIHAGDGQETSARSRDIWSHHWAILDGTRCGGDTPRTIFVDGVRVADYLMASETSPLGVYVHEFGHEYGLPDLYDTSGATQGIGVWGVMGTGSWNGNPRGSVPAHFTAWSKAKLGWMAPTVVGQPLLPAEIPQLATDPVAYKLPVKSGTGGEEYFLVENRQPVGFDRGLPGSGLLVWHVDETRTDNANPNRRLVDLEEADEARGALFADNPTQASDPWADAPEGFTPDSVPNSNDNDGARTGWKVTAIGPSGTVMTANLTKGVALDLAIFDVLRPPFVVLNQSVTAEVPVVNRGLLEVSNATVSLDVYLGAYDPDTRVFREEQDLPALAEGDRVSLSFAFVPREAGRYLLEALVLLEGDEFPENNVRLVHLRAGQHLFLEDVEGDVTAWSAQADLLAAHRWQVVEDGQGFGTAHSPTRAWRFGFYESGVVQDDPYVLESPEVSLRGERPRLLFFHRYELGTSPEESGSGTPESDRAWVEVAFDDGPWVPVANYSGVQLTWERGYVDLAARADGAQRLRVRFLVTVDVQPNDGGWWIDDVAVLTVPLAPAALLKPLETQKEVRPGDTASFLFVLVNVGDLPAEFRFRVEGLPVDWSAAIGRNATTAVPVEDHRVVLDVDQQVFLSLVVSAPVLAERGRLHQGSLLAFTADNATGTSFIFSVQVPLGLGFNLSGRTLVVAFLVGGVMLALAVVLTALRRRQEPY